MTYLSMPFVPAFNTLGVIAPAARMEFYVTETTTPANVYSDPALSTSIGSTVIADAFGRFVAIYLDPAVTYRVRLETSLGALIQEADGITGGGSASDIVIIPDGTGGIPTTLPVIFNRLHVWTEDYDTFQQAFDAAVLRGAELHFRPGQTYSWTSAVTLTGKVVVKATGAIINVPNAITALTIPIAAAGTEIIGGTFVYTGSTTSGYNAGSGAILVSGTLNGAGVAPTFIENVYVRNTTFNGFGSIAIEHRYSRNCGDENVRILNTGYSGVFLYSVDIYRSLNLFVNTLAGQLDTGVLATSELNAYGITATALTGGTPDRVQNPYSRDIVVDSPTFFNIPTWHAADSHGSDQMIVKNATIINCRRGVVFTGLSDRGSTNCKAISCTATNNFTASATNGNGSSKKGEAFWDIGPSTSARNSFNSFLGCTSFGHGDPGADSGAVTMGNANDGYYQIQDEQSYRVGWKIAGNILRATIDARSTNTRSASVNPLVARVEGNDIDLRIAKWHSGDRNTGVDTNVMINGIVVVNTNTGNTIHFEDFDLTDCTAGEILSSSGSTIAATLTGNFSINADITITGITATVTGSVKFVRRGPLCFAQFPAINGTSNTTACTLTGVPAAFRPASSVGAGTIAALDNSNFILAHGIIDSGGVITLTRDADNNTSAWTAAGTKGVRSGPMMWVV